MASSGGFLYAIGAEGTSLVKIGCTKTVQRRLRALQVGQPFSLRVLAAIPVEENMRQIEKQIHTFLIEERRRGEWFDVPMDEVQLAALVLRALTHLEEQAEAYRQKIKHQERAKIEDQGREIYQIGKRIKHLRMLRKLTMRQLALLANIPQSTLSSVEIGTRAGGNLTLETGKRLARALGVSLDVIAGTYQIPVAILGVE